MAGSWPGCVGPAATRPARRAVRVVRGGLHRSTPVRAGAGSARPGCRRSGVPAAGSAFHAAPGPVGGGSPQVAGDTEFELGGESAKVQHVARTRTARKRAERRTETTRMWLSGRASPCQGEGRGFESRHPLGRGSQVGPRLTRWSGREARQRPAKPCTRVQIPSPPHNAVRTGSTDSVLICCRPARLAQRESASLTRKRSLVQSQYRARNPSTTPARLAQRESASLTRKRSLVQSQYRARNPSTTPARLAQRESASLTRKRSLVQSQYRAPSAHTAARPPPALRWRPLSFSSPRSYPASYPASVLSAPSGGPPRSPVPRTGTSRRRRRPAGPRPAGRWPAPPGGCVSPPACADGGPFLPSAWPRLVPTLAACIALGDSYGARTRSRRAGHLGGRAPRPPLVTNLRSCAAGGVMRGDRPRGIPREEGRRPGVLPEVEPGGPRVGGISGSSPRRPPRASPGQPRPMNLTIRQVVGVLRISAARCAVRKLSPGNQS
jgi:hypothetical protein